MEKKLQDTMTPFIGTKLLKAVPMTRGEYNVLRGWEIPAWEDPADHGYLVMYLDGGKPNHADFEGYVSWSPKEVFEKSYQATDAMGFGHALELVKMGGWVRTARMAKVNKSIVLALVTSETGQKVYYYDMDKQEFLCEFSNPLSILQGSFAGEDILATDWQLVPESLKRDPQ